jgi:hypothetical protein
MGTDEVLYGDSKGEIWPMWMTSIDGEDRKYLDSLYEQAGCKTIQDRISYLMKETDTDTISSRGVEIENLEDRLNILELIVISLT